MPIEQRKEKIKLVKCFAPRCQWTYGNLLAFCTGMIMWHWRSPALKCQN